MIGTFSPKLFLVKPIFWRNECNASPKYPPRTKELTLRCTFKSRLTWHRCQTSSQWGRELRVLLNKIYIYDFLMLNQPITHFFLFLPLQRIRCAAAHEMFLEDLIAPYQDAVCHSCSQPLKMWPAKKTSVFQCQECPLNNNFRENICGQQLFRCFPCGYDVCRWVNRWLAITRNAHITSVAHTYVHLLRAKEAMERMEIAYWKQGGNMHQLTYISLIMSGDVSWPIHFWSVVS